MKTAGDVPQHQPVRNSQRTGGRGERRDKRKESERKRDKEREVGKQKCRKRALCEEL